MTSKNITIMEPRTHLPTKAEMFSALHYNEMIKPEVREQIQEQNVITNGQKLNIIKTVSKKVFDTLSEEMLAKVDDALAKKTAERESKRKDEKDLMPEDYEM
jgi:hypothetical protein